VHAVWHDYKAPVSNIKTASNDPNGESEEKATYMGLRIILTSTYFVMNMGLFVGCADGT
jgi:hypothetical protein